MATNLHADDAFAEPAEWKPDPERFQDFVARMVYTKYAAQTHIPTVEGIVRGLPTNERSAVIRARVMEVIRYLAEAINEDQAQCAVLLMMDEVTVDNLSDEELEKQHPGYFALIDSFLAEVQDTSSLAEITLYAQGHLKQFASQVSDIAPPPAGQPYLWWARLPRSQTGSSQALPNAPLLLPESTQALAGPSSSHVGNMPPPGLPTPGHLSAVPSSTVTSGPPSLFMGSPHQPQPTAPVKSTRPLPGPPGTQSLGTTGASGKKPGASSGSKPPGRSGTPGSQPATASSAAGTKRRTPMDDTTAVSQHDVTEQPAPKKKKRVTVADSDRDDDNNPSDAAAAKKGNKGKGSTARGTKAAPNRRIKQEDDAGDDGPVSTAKYWDIRGPNAFLLKRWARKALETFKEGDVVDDYMLHQFTEWLGIKMVNAAVFKRACWTCHKNGALCLYRPPSARDTKGGGTNCCHCFQKKTKCSASKKDLDVANDVEFLFPQGIDGAMPSHEPPTAKVRVDLIKWLIGKGFLAQYPAYLHTTGAAEGSYREGQQPETDINSATSLYNRAPLIIDPAEPYPYAPYATDNPNGILDVAEREAFLKSEAEVVDSDEEVTKKPPRRPAASGKAASGSSGKAASGSSGKEALLGVVLPRQGSSNMMPGDFGDAVVTWLKANLATSLAASGISADLGRIADSVEALQRHAGMTPTISRHDLVSLHPQAHAPLGLLDSAVRSGTTAPAAPVYFPHGAHENDNMDVDALSATDIPSAKPMDVDQPLPEAVDAAVAKLEQPDASLQHDHTSQVAESAPSQQPTPAGHVGQQGAPAPISLGHQTTASSGQTAAIGRTTKTHMQS
ncbi:hypothetical protein PENSPDRAFT_694580 [Peniophora sp. CONT]|nr:hypothetical protein PENSPDRAFT_694580 [Peniophora sp. CONT]